MSKNIGKDREKSSSGVADKVIKFLGFNKSNSSQSTSSGTSSSVLFNNGCQQISNITSKLINDLQIECELTVDQKYDMSRKSSLSTRIKTIKELEEVVENKRLVDFTVEFIFQETVDLLEENQSLEVRHNVWKFYKSIVCGQSEKLKNLRYFLMQLIIVNDIHDEDIQLRLDLLVALTDCGKNIEYCETIIGSFVVEWFDKVVNTVPKITSEFLSLLSNLIKFNAAYFDQSIIAHIIIKTCLLTNRVTTNEDMKSCYQILDVVLCYSNLPSKTLTQFVVVLCKGVNISVFHEICVKIMRNLLGTHLGHSCVDTLRFLLCDQMNHEDISLMRGSIHFLTQSLWDRMRVESLKHNPSSILPAYKCALECKNTFVALEVTISLSCYIDSQNKNISEHTWDLILDICQFIVNNYDISYNSSSNEFHNKVHKLLDMIEDLNEDHNFYGDSNKLFDILELCSVHRSVIILNLLYYELFFS
jgi:tuberous sclerosis protein 2